MSRMLRHSWAWAVCLLILLLCALLMATSSVMANEDTPALLPDGTTLPAAPAFRWYSPVDLVRPASALCRIDKDGLYARGTDYAALSCPAYRRTVAEYASELGRYSTPVIYWLCWLLDPCSKE